MYQTLGKPIHNAKIQGDPTHTKTLRDNFVKEADRRFKALKLVIKQSIVDNDCFNLREENNTPVTQAAPSNTTGPSWQNIKGEFNPIPARRFNFARSGDKVQGFMDWLGEQENKGILQVSEAPQMGEAMEKQWQNKYIQSSYKKGITRGRQELQNAGYSVPSIEQQGGVDAAFNQPFHADRVGAMYTRAFNELKGITNAMDQQISRTLADGMAQGLGPEQMARNINDRVDKIGRARARTLARTETIRAHHTATIQEYESAGAEGVTVKAEWSTAGDTKVCPLCAPLEGQEYDLKTIRGMIPRHPNCRCVALPLDRSEVGPQQPAQEPAATTRESGTGYQWQDVNSLDEAESSLQQFGFRTVDGDNTNQIISKTNQYGAALSDVFNRKRKLREAFENQSSAPLRLNIKNKKTVGPGGANGAFDPDMDQIQVAGKINKASKVSVGKNNFAVGANDVDVLRHEFGHGVYKEILAKNEIGAWKQIWIDNGSDYFKANVSKYAGTNPSEAFAESFSAWTHPRYGTEGVKRLPSDIEEFLERNFGD